MPLSFDPAAAMAPGGVIDGLDNMGAAVVAALNRRADRKYGREAEDRRRAQQLEDRGYAEQLDRTNYTRTRNDQQADLQETRKHQGGILEAANQRADVATAEGNWEQQAQAYSPDMDKGGDLYSDLRGSLQSLEDEPRLRRLMALRDAAKARYVQSQSKIDKPPASATGGRGTGKPPATVITKNPTTGKTSVDYAATAQNYRAYVIAHPEQADAINQQIVKLNSLRQFEAGAPKRQTTPLDMSTFLNSQAVREMHPPKGYEGEDLQNMLDYTPGENGGAGTFKGRNVSKWWDSALEDWAQAPEHMQAMNAAVASDANNRRMADLAAFEHENNLYEAKRSELLSTIDGVMQPGQGPGTQMSGDELVDALIAQGAAEADYLSLDDAGRRDLLQQLLGQ